MARRPRPAPADRGARARRGGAGAGGQRPTCCKPSTPDTADHSISPGRWAWTRPRRRNQHMGHTPTRPRARLRPRRTPPHPRRPRHAADRRACAPTRPPHHEPGDPPHDRPQDHSSGQTEYADTLGSWITKAPWAPAHAWRGTESDEAPGLVQDPCPERPHLGPLPGSRRGDQAATFGCLGPAVEERDQRPALQLSRDQHRASDGGAEPGPCGLDQHTRLTVCNTQNPTRHTTHGVAPLTAPVTVHRKRPFAIQACKGIEIVGSQRKGNEMLDAGRHRPVAVSPPALAALFGLC